MTRYIIPVLFLVALAWGLTWRVQQVQLKAAEMAQSRGGAKNRATTVSVARVSRQNLETEIEELVNIRAPQVVNIAAKVSGRLDWLRGFEGDRVRKGELLVRVDPAELGSRVDEMRAALVASRARLRQARTGVGPQNAQVQATIEQAEAEVSAARAELRQAMASADARRATARHDEEEAQARLDDAHSRRNRLDALLAKGYVSTQEADTARTNEAIAQADLSSAKERIKLTEAQVKADLEVARENLNRAQARLKVARVNVAQDTMYTEHVRSLEAAVQQSQSALDNAKAQLDQTEVRSPIDGFVTGRLMDPGTMVTPGQPILTLVDIRQVWAEVSLSEEHAGRLQVGDRAPITLDALPGEVFTGAVIQINPAANSQSRSFTVRLLLDNPALRIKPGMFGRARFVVGRHTGALVVPREAIVKSPQGEAHVIVVEGDIARKIPVQIGSARGPYTEITHGVTAGQTVAILGHDKLQDGAKVKIAAPDEG